MLSFQLCKLVILTPGRPGPPTITAEGTDLTWSVRAYEPVIEYRIYYRPEKADEWNKYESVRASKGIHVYLGELAAAFNHLAAQVTTMVTTSGNTLCLYCHIWKLVCDTRLL